MLSLFGWDVLFFLLIVTDYLAKSELSEGIVAVEGPDARRGYTCIHFFLSHILCAFIADN